MRRVARCLGAFICASFLCVAIRAHAQWLTYPTPGVPRLPGGAVNLQAKPPRTADGRPDLSGVWQVEATPPDQMRRLYGAVNALSVPGDDVLTYSKYFLNLLVDFNASDTPLRADAAERFQRLMANRGTESPTINCLPPGLTQANLGSSPHKIVQARELIVIMYEAFGGHRQIYMDGRRLPVSSPQPLWLGYSVGRWDGDTLTIDTAGFNDRSRLDAFGHPHSEDLHITERFRRRDFGHMDVEMTIDDPKTFTRPFTVKAIDRLIPDSDVGEYYCAENEKDRAHIPGK